MELKGMEQLEKHVPDLNSPRGSMRVGLYALGWFLLGTFYFIITDHIPTWSIDSQIIIMALGYLLLSFFFSRKKAYQEKYKELAYRNAWAHFGIPGLVTVLSAAVHTGYMNGPFIPHGWWTNVFVALGWLMIIVGAVLAIRAVSAFGLDNVTMLYVYYPEEGRIVDSSIYGVLRHPLYAGALRVVIGLALLNGNGNSLVFLFFLPILLFGWLRLVEEKELIERFGQSYVDYRKRVPAFWPRLQDLGKFFGFVLTGK
jgi:protein-S-isoprenylcysteine O-methyltransferase Ste14